MEQQIWPTKQLDGTIYERHVYGGPQGEGYFDITYREKAPGKFERKIVHVGPEVRNADGQFHDLNQDGVNLKLLRIKEEKAEWKPNIGFEVKPEFVEIIEVDGKEKPLKEGKP